MNVTIKTTGTSIVILALIGCAVSIGCGSEVGADATDNGGGQNDQPTPNGPPTSGVNPDNDGQGGNPGSTSCEDDRECGAGQICQDHLCRPDCDGGGSTSDDAGGGGQTQDAGSGSSEDSGGGSGGGNDAGSGNGDSGGSSGDAGDGTGSGCRRDSDCPDGKVCDDGACVPHCSGHDHSGGPPECPASKALVCHVPPGNHGEAHTICVGKSAVKAHLAHGDSAGACSGQ